MIAKIFKGIWAGINFSRRLIINFLFVLLVIVFIAGISSDDDKIIVWDPSMGWAGRLLAFLAASTHPDLIKKKCIYIGTDPNTGIYNRYKMVEKFWKTYVDKECTAEIIPLCIGSEEFHNTKEFKKYKKTTQ